MDCVDCALSNRVVPAACLCSCCGDAVCRDHFAQELATGQDHPGSDALTGSVSVCALCAQIITSQFSPDEELANP